MFPELRANILLLLAGIAVFIAMGAGQSLYGPALPTFAREYGIGSAEASLLISAHWVGCAFGVGLMFFAGQRIEPYHAGLVIAIGAAVMAAGLGWWPTLTGALALGAGYGTATVMFNRRFLTGFGARGAAMVSLVNAVFGIGAIGAPLAFVAVESQTGVAFATVAVLALAASAIAFRLGAVHADLAGGHQPYRLHYGVLGVGMLSIGAEASMIGLGPTALIALGKSETEAATLLSAFFVAFLVARLLLAAFANLIPALTLLTGSLVGAALLCLGTVLVSPTVCFVALGACGGLFFPPYFVSATGLMGNDPRVTPTIIAGGLVGGILAPVLIGSLLQIFGDRAFFYILAALAFAAAGLAVALAFRLAQPLARRATVQD